MSKREHSVPIKILIVLVLILILCGVSMEAILYFIPNWDDRAAFGNMFGAINTLITCFTLLGVVYTLYLQKESLDLQCKESQTKIEAALDQIDEMRKMRMQQAQPVPIVVVSKFSIEKPKLYYSPPEDEHLVCTRASMEFFVRNESEYPAVNVDIKAVIQIEEKGKSIEEPACAENIDIIPAGIHTSRNIKRGGFLFVEKVPELILTNVREGMMPLILLRILYKNILGTCFKMEQTYNIDASSMEQDEHFSVFQRILRSWRVEYKNEIEQLVYLKKTHNDDKWELLFQELKKKIESQSSVEEIIMKTLLVPNGFNVTMIAEGEYDKEKKSAFYGHPIPRLRRECPMTEKDE